MKTFTIALAALTAITSAAPTLETRTPGSVLICTGENYTGECERLQVPFNTCQQLAAPYRNNVGSFRPDVGAYCRITYTAEKCTTHGDAFVEPTPGAPTLHHFDDPATGTNMDAGSNMTSFLCQECTNCT
ncbi:hypothetical protein BDV96DRAFT_602799 [Lophiotrema nucula]|uniref:Uncharacterized protein n=1 Tax=Lophiotrema nucula TaxID=690887 RepID=A0A6A5YXE4_9PLEO|nr:hypothetical protein BDV96DRAFT_602799 [Lophiotrema nucula]